jgi:hypothetical protein
MQIIQEFSIEQGVIYPKTEPELGEYGNRGLENARIRRGVNLGSVMSGVGFLRGERGGD